MSESVPRILVIRRRYLGDLVLLGPVLHSLRTHWPHAHITVLTEASYAGVLAINPDVDETSHFPHSIGDWWALWRKLRGQVALRNALLCITACARHGAGRIRLSN